MKVAEKSPNKSKPVVLSEDEYLARIQAYVAIESKVIEAEKRLKAGISCYQLEQLRLLNEPVQDYEKQITVIDLQIHILAVERSLITLRRKRSCIAGAKRELREINKKRTRLAGCLPMKATE